MQINTSAQLGTILFINSILSLRLILSTSSVLSWNTSFLIVAACAGKCLNTSARLLVNCLFLGSGAGFSGNTPVASEMQDEGLVDTSVIVNSEWPEFVEQFLLLHQRWSGPVGGSPFDHRCGRSCKVVISPNWNLYACEATGKLHWCTKQSCRERVSTERGDVCLITGRSYGFHIVELAPHDLFKGNRFSHNRGRLMAQMGLFDDSSGAFEGRRQSQLEAKQLFVLREEASDVISAIAFSEQRLQLNRQMLAKLTAKYREQILSIGSSFPLLPFDRALDAVASALNAFALEVQPFRYMVSSDDQFVSELTDEVLKWWRMDFRDASVPSSFSVYVVCVFAICTTGLVCPDSKKVLVKKYTKASYYFAPYVHLNRFYGRTKPYTQGERAIRRAIICYHSKSLRKE